MKQPYHRFHIETKKAPNLVPHPYRFKVKIKRLQLAKLLLKELVHYRGNLNVVMSRPCVYGVFSGPLGGFAPREHLCVGCLRCTTEHPDIATILPNPERFTLGDEYFTPEYVDTVTFEAETGHIPIKGAGYRGPFGGSGWDGMWTDMSEIVRPTRDGIHGREFISMSVDIGGKNACLRFDDEEQPVGNLPVVPSIQIPLLWDAPPLANPEISSILSESAHQLHTFAVLPLKVIQDYSLTGSHLIPLVSDLPDHLGFDPLLIEMEQWNLDLFLVLQKEYPHAQIIVRSPFKFEELTEAYQAGVRTFHLVASYHEASIKELIREANQFFVKLGCREEVTLIGSGGIIAAEHVAKAILCGLDAVALDTSVMVALQARFAGPCKSRAESRFVLPAFTADWGVQRLKNLAGSWNDQLLEILGAMGLREVRRMRGEWGRVLFQKDLEKEAFGDIEGYGSP